MSELAAILGGALLWSAIDDMDKAPITTQTWAAFGVGAALVVFWMVAYLLGRDD